MAKEVIKGVSMGLESQKSKPMIFGVLWKFCAIKDKKRSRIDFLCLKRGCSCVILKYARPFENQVSMIIKAINKHHHTMSFPSSSFPAPRNTSSTIQQNLFFQNGGVCVCLAIAFFPIPFQDANHPLFMFLFPFPLSFFHISNKFIISSSNMVSSSSSSIIIRTNI